MILRLVTVFLSVARLSAATLTPEKLLGAPRRSSAEPNKAGTLALYSSATYSFEHHNETFTWNLLNLTNGDSTELFPQSKAKAACWIDDDTVLFTNSTTEDGTTGFWIVPHLKESEIYRATTVDGPVSDLQLRLVDGTVHFVFSSKANPNGTLYNPKKAHKPHASGRVYESLYVRHWDTYIQPETSSIFAGTLALKDNAYTTVSEPKNLLPAGSRLETPVQPFGGTDDFDIAPDGKHVVFLSKPPDLNPANNTQSLIYLVPFDNSREPVALNDPSDDNSPRSRGASAAPKFSPDGRSIAYLQMNENGYESDINKIYVATQGAPNIVMLVPTWDVSPSSIAWSPNGRFLFAQADNLGRHKLYRVEVETRTVEEVWGKHSVSAVKFLPNDKMLLTMSSFTSSPISFIFDPIAGRDQRLVALQSQPEGESHLSYTQQVEDLWFPGAEGIAVHGFIIKPSNFKPTEKYKMAFFIHGGPQGAWLDGWSRRWNPALFADHGYVVVAVNPTGSTGYGQNFVDAIQGQWGGRPYIDLEKAIEYLETHPEYNYIDFDNMVALGASYGGFMINYIQGMPLGRKFKALVCHDGVFSTLNQYSSEELYFPQHDFEGTIWGNREGYERWDPARLVANWKTPHMVIHGELDYRLPVSEGLAVFNVLQERGIPSKFLHFPDENHWVLKTENSLQWVVEVFEWLDRWTTTPSVKVPGGSGGRFLERGETGDIKEV